ncbi:cytochrome c oxidase subunit 3 [Sansalvadorimonas sp. 2012CJ34-2]|uniref:cytochrome-c oxidase n=1 Tax=Parendozoicomonas callyspongiae TaxID=2942213 RepID=A0ABT0PAR6_9GAMM|nr:cytochrome c oxidase subunit 3 [Sansalvadorimonas sp. 2012CJ34-2]MCL6268488.1 cytochrome c oxidase subunit 3 [Sansalvadorimonas sp. 2012CJ34-2]
MANDGEGTYYVPAQSKWPIVAAIGLFLTVTGMGMMMNSMTAGEDDPTGHYVLFAGGLMMAWMLFGWFGNVIEESRKGLYSDQMDRSFRWGMGWFIFSEVMFFSAFFGALFFVRYFGVPWLGGEGEKAATGMLWPGFTAEWPLMKNPDPESFKGPTGTIDPWTLPFINTLLLVTSSITCTKSHHALRDNNRDSSRNWLFVTLLLGFVFLGVQGYEYYHAYHELGLTLASGIYGSTFFMLTGFHGAHVTLGAIMLTVMFIRIIKGHFTPTNHFGFEAACWYWHFVDVVWIGLFLFVYIL